MFGKQWELLKFEIGCAVRTYGKRVAIKRKVDLLEISAEINNLIEKGIFTFEEHISLNKLQNKLDKI